MITVKGIELDIDIERNEDAKRIEDAKPSMKAAAEALQSKKASYDEIAMVCDKAVHDLLGDTEANKLNIDTSRWLDCIGAFSEVCTEITKAENAVQEKIKKYQVDRLGV